MGASSHMDARAAFRFADAIKVAPSLRAFIVWRAHRARVNVIPAQVLEDAAGPGLPKPVCCCQSRKPRR
jgi:hypothetical protein